MSIHKLTDLIIAQIAAGEVIESPSAVIKELLENSIDADSRKIEVNLVDMGMTSIQIRDDGKGIVPEDLPLALESFATSKIHSSDDLFRIASMGFRGEALSSIRSVSRITMESKVSELNHAWKIYGEGDFISQPQPCALPSGTRVVVENLFFNVPIRKKFIQNDIKLKQSIIELVISYAIAYPEIGWICSIDDEQLLNLPLASNLSQRLDQVYSGNFMKSMNPVYFELNGLKIQGYLSGSGVFHSRPVFIKFFVNQRPVTYAPLLKLLKRAYGELLPPGKYPAAFLFIDVDPADIDVNVHPQKKEIRFKDEALVDDVVYKSILKGIENRGSVDVSYKLRQTLKKDPLSSNIPMYTQSLNFDTPLYASDVNQKINVASDTFHRNVNLEDRIQPELIHSRLFDTFILATSRSGVFLIDQHTAHERIQYEMYLEKIKNNEVIQQTLLMPVVMELSPSEKSILSGNSDRISKFGFDLEDFGPAGIKINSVPAYILKGEEGEAMRVLLNLLSSDDHTSQEVLFDHMAKALSCRTAIKKGEQASLLDYSEIIEKLYQCNQPLRCPHGRPTVIFLSKNDILGLFNRPQMK